MLTRLLTRQLASPSTFRRGVFAFLAALYFAATSGLLGFIPDAQTAYAADVPYTVYFDHIKSEDASAATKTKLTNQLASIYKSLQSSLSILKGVRPDLTKVYFEYQNVVNSQNGCGTPNAGARIDGCYVVGTGTLLINIAAFGSTENSTHVIAHEILHSFVKGRSFQGSTGMSSEARYSYEEMFVEKFSREVYPATGYYEDLVSLTPSINAILSAAGSTNPEQDLQRGLFTGTFDAMEAKIDPYLTNKKFFATLGNYLNTDHNKIQTSGAQAYLDLVLTKIRQAKGLDCTPQNTTVDPSIEPTTQCLPTASISEIQLQELRFGPAEGTSKQMQVSWKTDVPVKGSAVSYGLKTDALNTMIKGTETEASTEHTVIVENLLPGTMYYFKPVNYADDGKTVAAMGTVEGATTSGDPSGANGQVFSGGASISVTGDTTAKVSWKTKSPFKGSDFKIKFDTVKTDLKVAAYPDNDAPATSFEYTLEGLQPGTQYYGKVTYIALGEDLAVGTDVVDFATTGINPKTGVAIGASALQNAINDRKAAMDGCVLSQKKGVLTEYTISATSTQGIFQCYVVQVIAENMKYAIMVATAIIALSGIGYMLSGGTPAALAKARQVILGVLGGVLLYVSIRFIVPLLFGGLSL